MFLLPSTILYTNCIDAASWAELSAEKYILGVTQRLQNGGTYPKLQVVKKDGYYFTLNDTKLQLYRYLEKIGQCGRVEVERVSLREVPEGIRNLMTVPEEPVTSKGKFLASMLFSANWIEKSQLDKTFICFPRVSHKKTMNVIIFRKGHPFGEII